MRHETTTDNIENGRCRRCGETIYGNPERVLCDLCRGGRIEGDNTHIGGHSGYDNTTGDYGKQYMKDYFFWRKWLGYNTNPVRKFYPPHMTHEKRAYIVQGAVRLWTPLRMPGANFGETVAGILRNMNIALSEEYPELWCRLEEECRCAVGIMLDAHDKNKTEIETDAQ